MRTHLATELFTIGVPISFKGITLLQALALSNEPGVRFDVASLDADWCAESMSVDYLQKVFDTALASDGLVAKLDKRSCTCDFIKFNVMK